MALNHPRFKDPANTLYLVDISSFIFRAFFAIRSLSTPSGEPANAVYGVASMLARLKDDAAPEYLGVVYDSKEPSFRSEIYPEYKANRDAAPPDLIPQFARIEELVRCMEIHSLRQSGVEADDLIGTLTRRWTAADPKHQVVIVSSDKDLMALVNDRVCLWDTMNGKVYAPDEVFEKFSVRPDQIRDYLALVGDSSDNIPGVPSIGPKSAADLLKLHGDLDAVLAAAEAGKIAGKKGEAIKAHVADARLSADLATIREELEIEFAPESFKYRFHVSDACAAFLREMNFTSLAAKWGADVGAAGAAKASAAASPSPAKPAPASAPPTLGAAQGSFALDSVPAAGFAPTPAASRAAAATGGAYRLPEVASDGGERFRTINTEESFRALLAALGRVRELGFDLETTSLNPREAEIVGIAVSYDPTFACYIPVGHRGLDTAAVEQLPLGRVMRGLQPFLEDPEFAKIGQNLKYDWSVLRERGVHPRGIGADTMVAAYVLDAEGRHNLETLCAQYLSYPVKTYEQVCGKGKDAIGFDQVDIATATLYSAEDAWVALNLWHCLKPRLAAEGLMGVFERIDLPLVEVLSTIELNGVSIDVPFLESLSKEFERDLRAIEERVGAHVPPGRPPLNLNSPKQLAQLLFEDLKLPTQAKTKTGFSTDASVLEALAPIHEVPKLLLEYREISKLKGTYVDVLPGMRDKKTGKIHAGFHQTVAATGRLSSSDPNLQNIPIRTARGRKIRRAFVPSAGNLLVSADYSQIELRLLAHMSGDVELSKSFNAGEDVHRRTASEIFGVPPAQVDDRQRGVAKAINFGLMYGKSAHGLAQELKIGRKEAQETIDKYFARYQGVKRYLDQLIVDAKDKGYSMTLAGRKRKLHDINATNQAVRGNAERMAMNTPIQGTAADLMKLAMVEIEHELERRQMRSKLIIQVHDEVVLECPQDEVAAAQELITRVMEGAMKLDVPLKVNAGSADNWMDL